ncbi:MAG: class I adenylate-forming enzyme family protein [Synergistaceae bacterium]|nr:class I adenylate-forming enzyme family protein [Synergistaceae bacterium]
MPITDFLKENATKYYNETALVEINPEITEYRRATWKELNLIEPAVTEVYRREITWEIFNEKANRVASLLISRGIKKGDHVAILMTNCLEWLPIYFGILKAGAVAVPLNFRYAADEIKYCLEKSDSITLFFGFEFIGRLESIVESIPRVRYLFYVGDSCPSWSENYYHLVANMSAREPEIPLKDTDKAAIYFSSGTTGFPKAILHNHESLMHAALTEQNHHGQTHDDCFLLIPPLYHTGAKMHWFGSLVTGSRAVILKGIKPEIILRVASDEVCTIVWLLVPWAQDILDALDSGRVKMSDYDLSKWRLMHIGAQPVPQVLITRWKTYFPQHQYDTNYGLSESTGPGCVHLGVENIAHVGAIGKPGYGWQAKIIKEDGTEVGKDEVGELIVKGPGLMTCYYNDPKATQETLRGGWLYTGDMAKYDSDGFIYLVDRKKDVIITGGENLYPVQIEDFIRRHNAVKDVAVIGLPDARLGEIAAAIIEIKDGAHATEEDINKFCLELPRYKRPVKIIFAEIPRNPTGKIEKPKLRKIYGAEKLVEEQVSRS